MAREGVQWRCDNQAEIEALLHPWEVQVEKSGDVLRVRGMGGLDIELEPGDSLLVEDGRLGVVRVPVEAKKPLSEKITVPCDECQRPVQTYQEIVMSPETFGIVCGEVCFEKRKAKLQNMTKDSFN